MWQLNSERHPKLQQEADIQERTAQRCINLLDWGHLRDVPSGSDRQLEHQVEADECYQSAGSKGLAHEVERCETRTRDNAGFSFAVEPPLRWVVHPCWAWCNAATRQTRTRQPRKFISKC